MTDDARPAPYLTGLLRHFADLRDGTHGGERTRAEKERLFLLAVDLLDVPARQALGELDDHLLLGTGTIDATGAVRSDDGVAATWTLSWPEQRGAGVRPVAVHAHYGRGFHHPHLRGSTVGEWPLNVFTPGEAAALLPTMRAIIAADLHNLVFERDYRIVPATTHVPADGT